MQETQEIQVHFLGQEEPCSRKWHLLQYSCLENPMDGGTWFGYSPWGRKESDTTEQLHSHMGFFHYFYTIKNISNLLIHL